ncbi:uncharacterized protein LOC109708965 isoform X1 [Ananas comosus]|uniref:Uncharacterized protein LOC109708965 isoform X1 n=1 Tax=Ananas comosus TaxID=4615 RepID=A0A6P5EZ93_ANACO|nr:uncharacterized protein LOC109708965 isoform X1 [Ananas comosus]
MASGDDEGIGYWMRWQVPVCALITAAPAIAAAVVLARVKREPLRSADLWAPCWGRLHPIALLCYRVLVFFAMASFLAVTVVNDGFGAFYFYTQWTFTLVIVYFAGNLRYVFLQIASVISAHGCWVYSKQHTTENDEANGFLNDDPEENPGDRISRPNKNDDQDQIRFSSHHGRLLYEERAGFWGYLMQIIYQTSAGAVVLTDVVFWGLLVPFLSSEYFRVNLIMACMHSVNAVFLLTDTALNNLPFPWFGMAYFIFWSCIYVVFQWVLHACGSTWWPYPFLELATPWAPLWYFFLALVHILCFSFYWLIAKAKVTYCPKLFPHAYVGLY